MGSVVWGCLISFLLISFHEFWVDTFVLDVFFFCFSILIRRLVWRKEVFRESFWWFLQGPAPLPVFM